MNNIEYLVGNSDIQSRPLQPFSSTACEFLNSVSSALIRNGREYPDVLSFAYWCRKANILRKKAAQTNLECRIGRGLAFHIAPSNIPINFAFSFAFSLLAGNLNIVRVPSKSFPQIEIVCTVLNTVLNDYPELKNSNALVRYPSDNAKITTMFSERADIRIIWGGDNTISSIRKMNTRPRCVDIAFADRYSMAMIDGDAVIQASDIEIKALAERFYNDTFLMDQNACSSPKLILWIKDDPLARQRFWDTVHAYARKKYMLQPATAIGKYINMFEDILNTDMVAKISYSDNYLYRVELEKLTTEVECMRGKAGYFYEYPIHGFSALCDIVTDKYQTITCFGIDQEALRTFILQQRLIGIDRIVSIGSAMDIDIVWDGYDLINILTRIISLS